MVFNQPLKLVHHQLVVLRLLPYARLFWFQNQVIYYTLRPLNEC
jgi:hypothetical protein